MHVAQMQSIVVTMDSIETSTLTDEELLAQSLERPSLFEALMMRYQKEFTSRINALVRNKDETEDIVQDTFIRIYRFAPKYNRDNGSFKSWAITILMNVARTKFAKGARNREVFAELTDEHFESLKDPVDSHNDYMDKVEVERVLGKLDADDAALLSAAYIEGLPYAIIAAQEGVSEGAIKARVHRAKLAARNALEGERVL